MGLLPMLFFVLTALKSTRNMEIVLTLGLVYNDFAGYGVNEVMENLVCTSFSTSVLRHMSHF